MSQPADGGGTAGDPPDEPARPARGAGEADRADETPPGLPPQPAGGARVEPGTAPVAALQPAVVFPDDGPVSAWLRRADRRLGVTEQLVVFGLLGAVVLTAAAAALSDRLLGVSLGRWWFDIVRGGTFSVAMIGAVYASHQQRHLSMDLVSRRLPPRGRLILRIFLALFTIAVVGLLVRSGLHQLDTVASEGGDHFISTHTIVTFLPVGATLIIVHTVLHMLIDLDYLARGKAPPERMRSAH